MKKNRMMRLASILLVFVLLTSCVISGTFAKYTTEITNNDSARVARWGFTGVNEDIAITDLFVASYDNDDEDTTVFSSDNVIAPGTSNSATFQFKYTAADGATAPEVAYSVVIEAHDSTCNASIIANNNIRWAVTKTADLDSGTTPDWLEWEYFLDAIEALAYVDGSNEYAPGDLPPIADEYTIEWKWDFETEDDNDQDKQDTAMGNAGDLNVEIIITINATQID